MKRRLVVPDINCELAGWFLLAAPGNDSFADVLKAHLAERKVALSSPALGNVPTGICIVLSGAVSGGDR